MRYLGWLVGFYLLLEIVTISLVVSLIGFLWSFVLWAAFFLAGALLLKKQGSAWRELTRRGPEQILSIGLQAVPNWRYGAAAILLMLPGFFNDFIAFALLLPLLAPFYRRFFTGKGGKSRVTPDEIIEGEYREIPKEKLPSKK